MNTATALSASPDASCDVLVIGGGPGGLTISTLLALKGRDVVMLEKAHHPRFHIGESLLPANGKLFERLGVRDQVERIGMPKWGVEFISPDHADKSYVEFGDAWDKTMPYAWQVRRSDLDDILFRNAKEKGVRAFEGTRVLNVAFDDAGATVQVEQDDGSRQTWRTRYVVDASGRDTLLANQFKCKDKHPQHNSAAVYGHFKGAKRLEGKREGNITIMWFAHGWFWFIPLVDGSTSIGAVCWPYYLKTRGTRSLVDFFRDTIAMCPELAARLEGAELIDDQVYATGNYSYLSSRSSGPGYLMMGDAYAFIDPVFSSGVFLAMQNGFDAVDLVETSLDRPHRAEAARRLYDRRLRFGPKHFSWFIFRVTNPTIRDFFMSPANPMRVKEALLSLLAGDIYGNTPIWRSIAALKGLYYLVSLTQLRRTVAAWRRHRMQIRDVEATAP